MHKLEKLILESYAQLLTEMDGGRLFDYFKSKGYDLTERRPDGYPPKEGVEGYMVSRGEGRAPQAVIFQYNKDTDEFTISRMSGYRIDQKDAIKAGMRQAGRSGVAGIDSYMTDGNYTPVSISAEGLKDIVDHVMTGLDREGEAQRAYYADRGRTSGTIDEMAKDEMEDKAGSNVLQWEDLTDKQRAGIVKRYGEPMFNGEHDFFSSNMETYFKTYSKNKETGQIGHKVIKLPSFGSLYKNFSDIIADIKKLMGSDDVRKDEAAREFFELTKTNFRKLQRYLRTERPEQYRMLKMQRMMEGIQKAFNKIEEGINDHLDLVHVYDKDGRMFGTGSVEKVEGDKTFVRFDGSTVRRFPSDRVKPVKEALDINDPALMRARVAKMRADDLKKLDAYRKSPEGRAAARAQASAERKEEKAREIVRKLKIKRAQIEREMENDPDIEPQGGPVADMYGDQLNKIDNAIEKAASVYNKPMDYDTAVGLRENQPTAFDDESLDALRDIFLKYVEDPDDAEKLVQQVDDHGLDSLPSDLEAQLERDPEFEAWYHKLHYGSDADTDYMQRRRAEKDYMNESLLDEVEDEPQPEEEGDKEAPKDTVLEDATDQILAKFPTLQAAIIKLQTEDFKEFVDSIDWISPRPTEFRINLKNGQDYILKWTGTGFEAQIMGKRFYIDKINDYQQALDKLAILYKEGPMTGAGEGEPADVDSGGSSGGGGGDFPGTDTAGGGGEDDLGADDLGGEEGGEEGGADLGGEPIDFEEPAEEPEA